jgi:eukaryotic-like serine/threonine-protein kinase
LTPTTLIRGSRVGSYEILSSLGEGGMGAVYRARDTKLNRDVAIKTLLPAVANDPARLARFQREAQVLASLNHPNIAAIYGLEEGLVGPVAHVGQLGDVGRDEPIGPLIVMELVEGPTLADRIANGAIPLDDAVPIAKQVADALEAAHEHHIIHRDLKPANIKVRADGVVKVLDFGLAKALESSEASHQGRSQWPTITSPAMMTGPGIVLGTAAYMSPEQAKGRPVDRRADIWAFGCVLYEMLTGARPFAGEDVSETLASVLRSEPDWNALPARTPANILTLLRRCLKKDPQHRVAHMSTARLELSEPIVAQAPSSEISRDSQRTARHGRTVERVAWIALCALLAAGLAYALRSAPRTDGPGPVLRFRIDPPPGELLPGAGGAPRFAVSPDGAYVVYGSSLPGQHDSLWLHRLDSNRAQSLRTTESPPAAGAAVQQPFWSPDSRSVAYFDAPGRRLKRIDINGGAPQVVCEVGGQNFGGSWSRDGIILVASSETAGIRRVSVTEGTLEPVTRLDESRHEVTHLYPQFLPDGRHFLFHVKSSDAADSDAVYLGTLDSSERVRLVAADGMATFAPPNFVLYARGESLLAQTLDFVKMTLVGEPVLVSASIRRPVNGRLPVSSSASGVLALAEGATADEAHTVWVDRNGKEIPGVPDLTVRPGVLRLSPDGRRLAFVRGFQADVWIQDLDRGVQNRLTTDPGIDTDPVWSPDGSRIAFRGQRGQREGIYQKLVSGASAEELVLESPKADRGVAPTDWSADGRFLLFDDRPPGVLLNTLRGSEDVMVFPWDAPRKPRPYVSTPFGEGHARFSPDGRWVAYDSLESGVNQTYIQSFPDPTRDRRQVSTDRGSAPHWRHDGRELYYLDGRARMVAVPVAAGDRVELGQARALFETGAFTAFNDFEVSPDGQRFVLVKGLGENPITIVVNWTTGLKK